MATPLEFDLSGLDPEQQKALQRFRGAAAASAPAPGGPNQFGRAPGAPISNRMGPGRPSAEAAAINKPPASAAAAAAAPKPPVPKPAGVRAASAGNKMLGRVAMPIAATVEGLRTYSDVTTPGMSTADKVARGAEATGRLAGAYVGAQGGGALGAMTGPFAPVAAPVGAVAGGALGYFAPDLVNTAVNWFRGTDTELASDKASRLRAEQAPQPVAPTPTPAVASAPAGPSRPVIPPAISALIPGSPEARAANKALEGRGVPEPGTGILRNDQTGNITTFNTPPMAPLQGEVLPPEAGPVTAPALGTQGGIFTNLAQFQKDYGAAAQGTALGARSYRRKQEADALAAAQSNNALNAALKIAGLGIQQQTADAATASAQARAATGNVVTSFDAAGNPVLINKATNRMTKPTVVPTYAEFDAKMREDARNADITPEEMAAAYKEQFGQ